MAHLGPSRVSEQIRESVYHPDAWPIVSGCQLTECSDRARRGDEMTRRGPGDEQHGGQERPRSPDRRGEVCLRAKGIRSTTVSEVAEVAQVSRGWLYRHFPDKASLLGAAIVRLNEAYWSEAHAMLEPIDGLDQQIAKGVVNAQWRGARPPLRRPGHAADAAADGRTRGVRRVRRRRRAGAGAGSGRLLAALCGRRASSSGEIHPDTDIDEASEWVARVIISLVTVPGDTLDPSDPDQVRAHLRRYVMPGLKADPAGSS